MSVCFLNEVLHLTRRALLIFTLAVILFYSPVFQVFKGNEQDTVCAVKDSGSWNISPDTSCVNRMAQPTTTGPLNICK